jgi:hypothetical protein
MRSRYLRVLKTIVDMGADVNLRNKNGETPLHAACFKSNKLAVSFLLQKGSNPNVKNSQGRALAASCYGRFSLLLTWLPIRRNSSPLCRPFQLEGPGIGAAALRGRPSYRRRSATRYDFLKCEVTELMST